MVVVVVVTVRVVVMVVYVEERVGRGSRMKDGRVS